MTKIKKALCAIMVLCLLIIGASSMATVSFAESDKQPVSQIAPVQSATTIEPMAAVPGAPYCIVHTSQSFNLSDSFVTNNVTINNSDVYNTAVVYEWRVGTNASDLAMSTNDNLYYTGFGLTYTEYAFPVTVGDQDCNPQFHYAKSYNGNYSTATSIAWNKYINAIPTYETMYSYQCTYAVVGRFNAAAVTGTIPTSYDKTNYIWSHGSDKNHSIRATIAFGGEISNIDLDIPVLGYKTSSVTLGGVKFTLRTGPHKCSIKANTSVNVGDLQFAFGIGEKIK